ncbi:hypothetical protein V8F20_005695 [Naviculisporaceae sp. PSN 640]
MEIIYSPPKSSKPPKQTKFRGRDYSVYEAVDGLVTTNDPKSIRIAKRSAVPSQVPIDSVRRRRIAPEDVLFRRKKAPTRYAEHDIYWANERELPEGGRAAIKPVLPDSDLLKSIHGHACQFYEGLGRNEDQPAGETLARMLGEKSMDETALLAFGILLEEAGRARLGETGDLELEQFLEVQGQDEDGSIIGRVPISKPKPRRPRSRARSTSKKHEAGEELQVESEKERAPKRRRKA